MQKGNPLTASPAEQPAAPRSAGRRYAILHHTVRDGEHWDLLLEGDDALATWQLASRPVGCSALPISATRLPDHRKIYLEYEGPISGDRGRVTRIDDGEYRPLDRRADRHLFELEGRVLRGRFCLSRATADPPDRWTLSQA